jgi:hypothetical protein
MNQSPNSAALWTDAQGRSWSTAINVNTIKRVRDLAGINLLEVFDGQLLNRLSEDPELLVNMLFAVCKPQADAQSVTAEAFAELLVGDAIEQAATSLVQGLIDFFPKDRREVLRRLWTATGKAQTEAIKLVTSKLDATNIDATIAAVMEQAGNQIDRELQSLCAGSGNSRASSESIPVP